MSRLSLARLAILVVCLFVAACSVNSPIILETFWQINYRIISSESDPVEELSLFLHLSDEDGEDDIVSIELIHDSNELYWSLHDGVWERYEEDEEMWYGSSEIRMYRNGYFPRGGYRVRVTDRAGESVETTMYVSSDRGSPGFDEFPAIQVDPGKISIQSVFTNNELWFYDGGGGVVKIIATSSDVVGLDSILNQAERSRAVMVVAYSYDNSRGVGLISGGIDLP